MKKLVSLFSILSLIFLLISCDKESEEKLESIIRKWELVGYFSDNSTQIESEGFENIPVTITFNKDTFDGNTPNNSFFGIYDMDTNILILNQVNTTEVAESDWGIRFTNSLNQAYDDSLDNYILKYLVDKQTLSMEYNFDNFMKFNRL